MIDQRFIPILRLSRRPQTQPFAAFLAARLPGTYQLHNDRRKHERQERLTPLLGRRKQKHQYVCPERGRDHGLHPESLAPIRLTDLPPRSAKNIRPK